MLRWEMLSEELGLQDFLVALSRSFHHRGTTHEKSLDCLKRGVGTARRQSFDDRSDRVGHKSLQEHLSRWEPFHLALCRLTSVS